MLGEIQTLRAHLGYLPTWPRVNAKLPAMPVPPQDELDWDMWIGPSPFRDYNPQYLKAWPPPGWYSQYDFAGAIPQWGSHTIAQCQLDMGLAETSAVDYEYPEGGITQAKSMTIRFANNIKLVAHRTMSTNLIMDIALDLKRSLKWNPQTEEFVGDAEANKLRSRPMRQPWQITV